MDLDLTHSNVINILSRFDLPDEANRSFLKQISKPPTRFNITMLLLMAGMVICMGVSAMLTVRLEDPADWFKGIHTPLTYSLQIPFAVLVASFLGKRYGTLTIIFYLIAGFAGIPLFANGGGANYINQVSYAYLIGFVLVPAVVQPLISKAYCNTGWFKCRSLWIFMAALFGVMVIHMIGLAGLGIHVLRGALSITDAQQWILILSWPVIIYDIIFSFVAIASVRILRSIFWFCLY